MKLGSDNPWVILAISSKGSGKTLNLRTSPFRKGFASRTVLIYISKNLECFIKESNGLKNSTIKFHGFINSQLCVPLCPSRTSNTEWSQNPSWVFLGPCNCQCFIINTLKILKLKGNQFCLVYPSVNRRLKLFVKFKSRTDLQEIKIKAVLNPRRERCLTDATCFGVGSKMTETPV